MMPNAAPVKRYQGRIPRTPSFGFIVAAGLQGEIFASTNQIAPGQNVADGCLPVGTTVDFAVTVFTNNKTGELQIKADDIRVIKMGTAQAPQAYQPPQQQQQMGQQQMGQAPQQQQQYQPQQVQAPTSAYPPQQQQQNMMGGAPQQVG
jgi:hypothetical protein